MKAWDLLPDDMYTKLHAAYGQVAEEFQLGVIPVGTAFQNAKKRPLWDYQASDIETMLSSGQNRLKTKAQLATSR